MPLRIRNRALILALCDTRDQSSYSLALSSKKQDADSTEKSKLIKSLNISNNEALEAKVKKELQDQGILDFNDDNDDSNENDEIQEELLRCQAELKAISAHNLQQLKRLTKAVCKLQ